MSEQTVRKPGYSVKALAATICVHPRHIWRLLREKPDTLPIARRVPDGKRVFFLAEDVEAWLQKAAKRRGRPPRQSQEG